MKLSHYYKRYVRDTITTNPRSSLIIYVNHLTEEQWKIQGNPKNSQQFYWFYEPLSFCVKLKSQHLETIFTQESLENPRVLRLTLEVNEEPLDKKLLVIILNSMVETKSVPMMKVPADSMLEAFLNYCYYWSCTM